MLCTWGSLDSRRSWRTNSLFGRIFSFFILQFGEFKTSLNIFQRESEKIFRAVYRVKALENLVPWGPTSPGRPGKPLAPGSPIEPDSPAVTAQMSKLCCGSDVLQ